MPLKKPALIPAPESIEMLPGSYVVPASGSKKIPAKRKLDPSLRSLGEEGYQLEILSTGITIRAFRPAGLFYGEQTLRQLGGPVFPCLRIKDRPRYAWRGFMLDCCRHFLPLKAILKQIDLLAFHKMNRFHWHLTEDQAWRLEIKKYPRLTEVGAWRQKNGKRYGGFYTQSQVKEVLAYAKARHITVVPEIEMPGHARAALAAYPELSCCGGASEVPGEWGIHKDVYCAGKESTFRFIEGVLDEVCALFPGPYVHIGGDECPKDRWRSHSLDQTRMLEQGLKDERQLQSWFLRRVHAMLKARGKRMIGWDEIHQGGVPGDSIVQWWLDPQAVREAARQGHSVIASPHLNTYLDYGHSTTTRHRLYSFDLHPPGLEKRHWKHILGGEAPLWTEGVPNAERAEYRSWPRLCALSENLWTQASAKNFRSFEDRLQVHKMRLKALKVDARDLGDRVALWSPKDLSKKGKRFSVDLGGLLKGPGRYELRFEYEQGLDRIELRNLRLTPKLALKKPEAQKNVIAYKGPDTSFQFWIAKKDLLRPLTLKMTLATHSQGTANRGAIYLKRLSS